MNWTAKTAGANIYLGFPTIVSRVTSRVEPAAASRRWCGAAESDCDRVLHSERALQPRVAPQHLYAESAIGTLSMPFDDLLICGPAQVSCEHIAAGTKHGACGMFHQRHVTDVESKTHLAEWLGE
jgi:hypothetical protein